MILERHKEINNVDLMHQHLHTRDKISTYNNITRYKCIIIYDGNIAVKQHAKYA